MKSMLLLSQCMDFKTKVLDLGYELRFLTCLVVTVLAWSVFKFVYFYYSSTHNVRKVKQMLESSRSQWRSGDTTHSRPVSPLPKIERVPTCLSLRRRSALDPSVKITHPQQNDEHSSSNESIQKMDTLRHSSSTENIQKMENLRRHSFSSSNDSLNKMRNLQVNTPPCRSHIKSSTNERKESPPRRSKNQIISAEMLM